MTNTVNNEGLGIKELLIAFIVSLVLMFLADSGYAQGISTVKSADVIEATSPVKEVKSAIVVPATLAKAMVEAKEGIQGKVNTLGAKTAKYHVSYNAKVDDLVWFYPNAAGQTGCSTSGFNLNIGEQQPAPDGGCPETDLYCCAIGYNVADCELVDGVYRVKSSAIGNYVSIRKRNTP